MNKAAEESLKKLAELRPPGIWLYVKDQYEPVFLKELDDRNERGIHRSIGKYKDLESYIRDQIGSCDYSREPFADEDTVVRYWVTCKI